MEPVYGIHKDICTQPSNHINMNMTSGFGWVQLKISCQKYCGFLQKPGKISLHLHNKWTMGSWRWDITFFVCSKIYSLPLTLMGFLGCHMISVCMKMRLNITYNWSTFITKRPDVCKFAKDIYHQPKEMYDLLKRKQFCLTVWKTWSSLGHTEFVTSYILIIKNCL